MKVDEDLTVFILTYNELASIERTMNSVTLTPHILVIDRGSTDHALAIIAKFKQAKVEFRPFDIMPTNAIWG